MKIRKNCLIAMFLAVWITCGLIGDYHVFDLISEKRDVMFSDLAVLGTVGVVMGPVMLIATGGYKLNRYLGIIIPKKEP